MTGSKPSTAQALDVEVIERYLARECSPEEARLVEQWIAGGRGGGIAALDAYYLAAEHDIPSSDLEKVCDHLSVHLKEVCASSGMVALDRKVQDGGRVHKVLRQWVGYVTVTALLVAFAFYQYPTFGESSTAIKPVEYTTANGQRAVVTLGDGSQVTLAPATTARIVPGKSANQLLIVELQGEALFDVSQNRSRGFQVRANGVTIRVLGTTFGVRAYGSDKDVKVGVRTGRVSVAGKSLSAGDIATIGRDGVQIIRATDMSSIMAWQNGMLRFDDVSVADAIPDLSRWFDVTIKLSDPALGRETLKGAIPSGSRADLARLLSVVTGMRAELSGKTLTLYSK